MLFLSLVDGSMPDTQPSVTYMPQPANSLVGVNHGHMQSDASNSPTPMVGITRDKH